MAAVPELVENNMRLFSSQQVKDTPVQGRTLWQLRQQTRDLVLNHAQRYTKSLGCEVDFDSTINESIPLIVGGHQPALFHAGVWAKNFSLHQSAKRTNGLALNLVIDNDTLNAPRVRIPSGSRENPRIDSVAFDAERPSEPWEDAKVLNQDTYQSFADRCSAAMSNWNIEPVLADVWPQAVEQANKTKSLRDSLTCARVLLERDFGVTNLEIPLSVVCQTEPFLRFASHILAHLPRFQQIHNHVLTEYREANRVRSKTHPVPELTELSEDDGSNNDWLEAPFWMWHQGDKQRRHVFARQLEKSIELSDGVTTFATLPLTPDMDACCAIEALQETLSSGIRFRPRALTTTLFARLFLSDLFVHGIGGAKYDEMTDRIIAEFFEIPAPEFQVVSATLHLPFAETFDSNPEDIRQLQHELRDVRYNAQRRLPQDSQSADAKMLLEEKAALIAAERNKQIGREFRGANYDRFRQLRDLNQRLLKVSSDYRRQLQQNLAEKQAFVSANGVIQNREFSFALFPKTALQQFFSESFE